MTYINKIMKRDLEKYSYNFGNVESVVLKQPDTKTNVSDMYSGIWKTCVVCSKNKLSGIYFYNEDYISQYFTDTPLLMKEDSLDIILNDSELNSFETEIDGIKIFKEGLRINRNSLIFVSTLFNKICGFMIVPKDK